METRKPNEYCNTPECFLQRAHRRLTSEEPHELLYAALELRLGIEARLDEHKQGMENISKKLSKGWELAFVSRQIRKVFSQTDMAYSFELELDDGLPPIGFLYTPVSSRLVKIGARLGELLHFRKIPHHPGELWWNASRQLIVEGLQHLAIASVGELLAPPLVSPKTRIRRFTLRTTIKRAKEIVPRLQSRTKIKKVNIENLTVDQLLMLPGSKKFANI